MTIEVITEDKFETEGEDLYSLNKLNSNHSNRQALNKNMLFINAVADILINEFGCDKIPSNMELLKKLASKGLPIKLINGESGYTQDSVKIYIKNVKQAIVEQFNKALRFATLSLSAKGILGFRDKNAVIDANDFTRKDGKISSNKLAKAVRSKIDIGYKEYNEDFYISLVSEKLLELFKNSGFDTEVEKLKPFVKRFILAKRLGDEALLFTATYSKPLTRSEVLEKLHANNENGGMLTITPTDLYKNCGWLTDKVSQILKSKSPLIVSPVIAETLNSNIEISSYIDWSRKYERRNYLSYLLESDDLTVDPREINFAKIEAVGVITHYLGVSGRDNKHLKRHAYIRLCEEFMGKLPELYKDQILAKSDIFELKRLCLRYANPEAGPAYYLKLIMDEHYHTATEKLTEIENDLTYHFIANTPIAAIAAKYGVGRRGIDKLKEQFLGGRTRRNGNLRLWYRARKTLPNERTIKPNFQMLDMEELLFRLENNGAVKALTNNLKTKAKFDHIHKLCRLNEKLDKLKDKEMLSENGLLTIVKDLLSYIETLKGEEFKLPLAKRGTKNAHLILNDKSWNEIEKLLKGLKEELAERFLG